jgi:hypothetical protein
MPSRRHRQISTGGWNIDWIGVLNVLASRGVIYHLHPCFYIFAPERSRPGNYNLPLGYAAGSGRFAQCRLAGGGQRQPQASWPSGLSENLKRRLRGVTNHLTRSIVP